ncbi:hypothetical protein LBMAG52_32700 [Planctomycetia bacterium]|nr:hypothetical protein LBMAG52_32700 [Planctomycetia bacterium]
MNRSRTIRSRAGFTLVEMLMAVTLVLIMMVMFAEVFQIAGGAVTKQRTLADNDQNARTFATIMRADLDKRTFRTLLPFYPGEPTNSATSFNNRQGYFYISSNDPGDSSDDVLQFTVMSTVSLRNADESPYYGKAVQLPQPTPPGWNTTQQFYNFLQNPNQPERDDGQVIPNGAATSRAAEVSYFMRGSRLYRRVMLLRDPIPAPGVPSDLSNDPQPKSATGADYFSAVGGYSGNFWSDFDFSAYRLPTGINVVTGGTTPISARFVGLDFLGNAMATPPYPMTTGDPNEAIETYFYSLGQTWNRFGFNSEFALNSPLNGLPREFSGTNPATTGFFFLGRFSQEETSSSAFQYPYGAWSNGGNPLNTSNALVDTTPADGVVDGYAGGARAGVDLLLSNVHEFRVELWDERVGDFVPAGHTTGVGDFHSARQLNPDYHPLGRPASLTNIFDTWHPHFDRNLDNNQFNDPPPYRPLNYYPTGTPGPNAPYWTAGSSYSTEDANGNGVLDGSEDGTNGFPSDGLLNANVVFPFLDEDANGNSIADAGEDTNGNGAFDRGTMIIRPLGHSLAYRCIRSGTSNGGLANEPQWTTTPGVIVRGNEDLNSNGILDAGEDVIIPNGALDTGPDWICEYNARPLKAIRLTVRFEHPTSQQMKQVTIVHSLRDTTAVP